MLAIFNEKSLIQLVLIWRYFFMTSVGDVIRQVETALNDTQYPPTLEQREILTTILYRTFLESAEAGGNP
jgi:hypothetical protein